MDPLTPQQTQVLRTMDKADKIGIAGVVEQLQRPAEQFGAGLTRTQARMIGAFMATKGADNYATLANMRAWFAEATAFNAAITTAAQDLMIVERCRLVNLLDDEIVFSDGTTGLDRLMAMPTNADQTWRDGGRPENIAWAIDDILDAVSVAGTAPRDAAAAITAGRLPFLRWSEGWGAARKVKTDG
jgi:hypothetical protein